MLTAPHDSPPSANSSSVPPRAFSVRRRFEPPVGQRPKIERRTVFRLLSFAAHGRKAAFAVIGVCILISTLAGVSGSLFLKYLIDDCIAPLLLEAEPVYSDLLKAIAAMAMIYAAGVLSAFICSRLSVTIAHQVLKQLRDDMFVHMQSLPIRYFDTHSHGDIMSRYTNDADNLRQALSQTIPQTMSSVVTIVFVFAAMVVTSVPMTVFVLLFLFFMAAVTNLIGKKSAGHFADQQKDLGDLNGFTEEMIHGQKIIKVFCRERQIKDAFRLKNDELCKSTSKANAFSNILMPVIANLSHLQYVLIAALGGFLALSGLSVLTIGAIASFLQLSRSFTMPVSQISQQVNSVAMAFAGAQRIFDLLDEETETDDGRVILSHVRTDENGLFESETRTDQWAWKKTDPDGRVMLQPLRGDIVLESVNFGYVPDQEVIHSVSLHARPGRKIALVGATGAGKTTIANLISRFYDISSGRLLYDGTDIREIRKSDLRRSIGIVLQETALFTGTVMENLRCGRSEATDDECTAAAKEVYADDFIKKLPAGYDTVLSGGGSDLSQGQRQLLAIARAVVADPPVMILDEATSSVDTRTETIVQKGMDALMAGRTVFVIAHRLSTIRNADLILVLDQGRVVESGTHDTLMARKGRYFSLYAGNPATDA